MGMKIKILSLLLCFSAVCFSQNLKIGVALPLFEESEDNNQKQLGQDILNGIKFSLEQYNKTSKEKVLIDVKDTRKEIPTTAAIITGFGENEDVVAILGPVFSNELAAIVGAAENFKIPIVSPTATADDLAESHEYVFQLNPSYKVRGRTIANYLVKQLGLKNFVVIAEESYGTNFSKYFETEVTRLKGKTVLSDTYKSDVQNITPIISNIQKIIRDNDLFINLSNLNINQVKKLENAGLSYRLIDSLIDLRIDASIYYLFGKDAKKTLDTLNIKPYPLKKETQKFIQGYIDAIYIPVSNPSEISLVVPELYSSGLSFFIAGTGDWNNDKVLEENKVYLNKLLFESEYYLDENNPKLRELKDAVKNKKYNFNKSFLFGYDAMSLLLNVISDGNYTREEIYNALSKVSGFQAIKSKISLDNKRVNSDLNILTFDGSLKKLADYKIVK
jgi:ABC-type branched-subunit amino acid transport system substrate-binding protein